MPAQATTKFPKGILYDCENHTIWIRIWSNDECALIAAYTFRVLKRNHITGLVAESMKVVLKTQQTVCDHCELLPVGKGSCYAWCYFKRWSGPQSMKLMQKILISRKLLMMKIKMNSVLWSLILMKLFQSGLMKMRTECIDIVLLVKYQP